MQSSNAKCADSENSSPLCREHLTFNEEKKERIAPPAIDSGQANVWSPF